MNSPNATNSGLTTSPTKVPLNVSLEKLREAEIPFELLDKSPRTTDQVERVEVNWQGQALTYIGLGHFNSRMNYVMSELFQLHPTTDRLFEQYARQWADLTALDFNAEGGLETNHHTKWKKGHPTFEVWVEQNTDYCYSL